MFLFFFFFFLFCNNLQVGFTSVLCPMQPQGRTGRGESLEAARSLLDSVGCPARILADESADEAALLK